MFRHADSRTTLQLYENRARSDAAKVEAEQIHYRSQAMLDQIKVMKEGAMAQQEVASQKRKLADEEKAQKIRLFTSLEKHDEANKLTAELLAT